MRSKQRAALEGDWLLAAIPEPRKVASIKYILVNRRTGAARRIEAAPGPADAIAHRLWNALHTHFKGELAVGSSPQLSGTSMPL